MKIESLDSFHALALKHNLNHILEEGNRSIIQFKNLHPDHDLSEKKAEVLIQQLREGGYFSKSIFYDPLIHPVFFNSLNFEVEAKMQFDPAILDGLIVEDYIIPTILEGHDHPTSQLLALEILERKLDSAMTIQLLKSYLKSANSAVREKTIAMLKHEKILAGRASFRTAEEFSDYKLQKEILRTTINAKSKTQKCEAHYLSYLFSKYKAPVDAEMVMYCMDSDYPDQFFLDLFQSYPKVLAHSFIKPFREGYGVHFQILLKIFKQMMDDSQIREAMVYALVHRQEGHFQKHQNSIISVWEQLTAIPFNGTIDAYLKWASSGNKRGSKTQGDL